MVRHAPPACDGCGLKVCTRIGRMAGAVMCHGRGGYRPLLACRCHGIPVPAYPHRFIRHAGLTE